MHISTTIPDSATKAAQAVLAILKKTPVKEARSTAKDIRKVNSGKF